MSKIYWETETATQSNYSVNVFISAVIRKDIFMQRSIKICCQPLVAM